MSDSRGDSLRATWPIRGREVRWLLGGYVVLVGVWIGFGELITGPFADSALTRNDRRIAQWFVAQRTPAWNQLTSWGSNLAETSTKVIVTAFLAVVFLRVWRRWLEPMLLVVSLVIEAAAFIVVTTVVDRGRPEVPHLDSSPVGSSFPSGHVAASMAYIAIAVVVFWHIRNRLARAASALVATVVPVIVALSRMYRGMHFFSDVVGGALLGGAAVVLTVIVLHRSQQGIAALDSSLVRVSDGAGQVEADASGAAHAAPVLVDPRSDGRDAAGGAPSVGAR